MTNKELSIELQKWFDSGQIRHSHAFLRNPVGIVLKNELKSLGYWRNLLRGNPAKGKRIQLENRYKREN
jgi:hypothetical protein